MNELMNDKGVCRTALATPGLLISILFLRIISIKQLLIIMIGFQIPFQLIKIQS